MLDQLMTNIRMHLVFFRRSRLLTASAIIMLLVSLASIIPAVYFSSTRDEFEIVRGLFHRLTWLSIPFVSLMGLLLVSTHVRDRSLKMVLTKPCSIENWLFSGIVAALAVSLVLNTAFVTLAVILSVAMDVPLQPGFLFIGLDSVLATVVGVTFLVFLGRMMHPILAMIVALLLSESSVYRLWFIVRGGAMATGGGPLGSLFDGLLAVLYWILPMYSPFQDQTGAVYGSLRVSGDQWLCLFYSAGYSLSAGCLFLMLTLLIFRRQRLT